MVGLCDSHYRYLLPYENVSPEYREEFRAFLKSFGVDVEKADTAVQPTLPTEELGLGRDAEVAGNMEMEWSHS